MYDSRAVANQLLNFARERGEALTPMQVIKLVYIAHGWMLGLYHRPLIRDDVEAWQYGPVIPRLYNAVRKFKSRPVEEISGANNEPPLDVQAINMINQVFDRYGRFSGPALSRMTHAPETPWALTYEEGRFGIPIPTDLIEDHYAKLGNKAA
jgi:uncharacterized phage-associated protein